MARYTVEENDQFISIDAGPITKVIVTNLVHHVTGVGYAKLNVVDEYNVSFGIELAMVRAYERLYRKLTKKLVKSVG